MSDFTSFSVWFSLQVEVNGQINDKDTINTDIQSGNKVKKEKKQVDFFPIKHISFVVSNCHFN